MKIIKANHDHKIRLVGVPEPVSRPVNIDQRHTDFALLRSLRIYRFCAGSIIYGHAEDDEVVMVVLSGSVQLTMSGRNLEESSPSFHMTAVSNTTGDRCAAYLPPNGAYRLVAEGDAEVAYARATTSNIRAPRTFSTRPLSGANRSPEHRVLFEETTYPTHLRLYVIQLSCAPGAFQVAPFEKAGSCHEALIHITGQPGTKPLTMTTAHAPPIALESWDTVAVLLQERPILSLAENSPALLLVFLAAR